MSNDKNSEIKNKIRSSTSGSEKAKDKNNSSKSLVVVALRNKFFFMLYRYSMLLFLFSLLTLGVTIFMFVFFLRQPVPPQYVPINEDGTYITLSPVDDCESKTEGEVRSFALDAIKGLYKYDYVNYPDQIQSAAPYFTGQAWNDYLDSFAKSDILTSVKENKWIVTFTPLAAPEITKKVYIEDGACTWEVKAPIDVTYMGQKSIKQSGDVWLRVSRVSVLKNPDGLGIKRFVFSPKTKDRN